MQGHVEDRLSALYQSQKNSEKALDAHEKQIRDSRDELVHFMQHTQNFEREIREDIARIEAFIQTPTKFERSKVISNTYQPDEVWPKIEEFMHRGLEANREWAKEMECLHEKLKVLERKTVEPLSGSLKNRLDPSCEGSVPKLRKRVLELENLHQEMVIGHKSAMSKLVQENEALRLDLVGLQDAQMTAAWDADRARQISDLEAQLEILGSENEGLQKDRDALLVARKVMETEIQSLERVIAKQTQDITLLNQQLQDPELNSASELESNYEGDSAVLEDHTESLKMPRENSVTFQEPEFEEEKEEYEEDFVEEIESPKEDYDQLQSLEEFKNLSFVEAVKYHMKERAEGLDLRDELQIEISKLQDELTLQSEKNDAMEKRESESMEKLEEIQKQQEISRRKAEELETLYEAKKAEVEDYEAKLNLRDTQLKDLWQRFEEEKSRWEKEKRPLLDNMSKQLQDAKRAADLERKVKELQNVLRSKEHKIQEMSENADSESEVSRVKNRRSTNTSIDSVQFGKEERFDSSFLCISCRSRYIRQRAQASADRKSGELLSPDERPTQTPRFKRTREASPQHNFKRTPLIAPKRRAPTTPSTNESESVDFSRAIQMSRSQSENRSKNLPTIAIRRLTSDRFRNYKKSVLAARRTIGEKRTISTSSERYPTLRLQNT